MNKKYKKQKTKLEKLSLFALISAIVIVSISFFFVIKMFVVPIILAMTFVTLFYPIYKKLLHIFISKNLTSLIVCILLLISLIIPLYFIGFAVVKQGKSLSENIKTVITKAINNKNAKENNDNIIDKINQSKILKYFKIDINKIEWKKTLLKSTETIGKLFSKIINKTSKGIIWAISNVFIVLFTMFYFFRDGEKILKRLIFLSPFKPKYEKKIITNFTLISRATIKGTLVIGVIQGTLGAITLLIFGVKSWILWGVFMIVLSVIPFVGPWLIMIPIGIVNIIVGNIWQGIGIILICVFVISTVDNFIRPRLVGQDAKIHDLIIFFSTLGGLAVFGVMGFIIGPVIAVLFVTVLDIYGLEFKSELDMSQKRE